jgi:hypothetical protein
LKGKRRVRTSVIAHNVHRVALRALTEAHPPPSNLYRIQYLPAIPVVGRQAALLSSARLGGETLLIVQQNTTIQAQKNLIQVLLGDLDPWSAPEYEEVRPYEIIMKSGSERETVRPPAEMGVLILGDSGYTRQDERGGLEQSTGVAGVSGLPARDR